MVTLSSLSSTLHMPPRQRRLHAGGLDLQTVFAPELVRVTDTAALASAYRDPANINVEIELPRYTTREVNHDVREALTVPIDDVRFSIKHKDVTDRLIHAFPAQLRAVLRDLPALQAELATRIYQAYDVSGAPEMEAELFWCGKKVDSLTDRGHSLAVVYDGQYIKSQQARLDSKFVPPGSIGVSAGNRDIADRLQPQDGRSYLLLNVTWPGRPRDERAINQDAQVTQQFVLDRLADNKFATAGIRAADKTDRFIQKRAASLKLCADNAHSKEEQAKFRKDYETLLKQITDPNIAPLLKPGTLLAVIGDLRDYAARNPAFQDHAFAAKLVKATERLNTISLLLAPQALDMHVSITGDLNVSSRDVQGFIKSVAKGRADLSLELLKELDFAEARPLIDGLQIDPDHRDILLKDMPELAEAFAAVETQLLHSGMAKSVQTENDVILLSNDDITDKLAPDILSYLKDGPSSDIVSRRALPDDEAFTVDALETDAKDMISIMMDTTVQAEANSPQTLAGAQENQESLKTARVFPLGVFPLGDTPALHMDELQAGKEAVTLTQNAFADKTLTVVRDPHAPILDQTTLAAKQGGLGADLSRADLDKLIEQMVAQDAAANKSGVEVNFDHTAHESVLQEILFRPGVSEATRQRALAALRLKQGGAANAPGPAAVNDNDRDTDRAAFLARQEQERQFRDNQLQQERRLQQEKELGDALRKASEMAAAQITHLTNDPNRQLVPTSNPSQFNSSYNNPNSEYSPSVSAANPSHPTFLNTDKISPELVKHPHQEPIPTVQDIPDYTRSNRPPNPGHAPDFEGPPCPCGCGGKGKHIGPKPVPTPDEHSHDVEYERSRRPSESEHVPDFEGPPCPCGCGGKGRHLGTEPTPTPEQHVHEIEYSHARRPADPTPIPDFEGPPCPCGCGGKGKHIGSDPVPIAPSDAEPEYTRSRRPKNVEAEPDFEGPPCPCGCGGKGQHIGPGPAPSASTQTTVELDERITTDTNIEQDFQRSSQPPRAMPPEPGQ